MDDLFAGIDGECAVSVTFYLRPQLQWIPSAWKQWGLKTGASLSDFIPQCIGMRTPAFTRDIENWKSMLPRANIDVRFLIPELLAKATGVKIEIRGTIPLRLKTSSDVRR